MTDEEVKDFVAINFSKSIREEESLRKLSKSLYIFLATSNEVQSSSSDNCVHDYNVWIFLIQNYNWLTLKQWLKQIKRIAK